MKELLGEPLIFMYGEQKLHFIKSKSRFPKFYLENKENGMVFNYCYETNSLNIKKGDFRDVRYFNIKIPLKETKCAQFHNIANSFEVFRERVQEILEKEQK